MGGAQQITPHAPTKDCDSVLLERPGYSYRQEVRVTSAGANPFVFKPSGKCRKFQLRARTVGELGGRFVAVKSRKREVRGTGSVYAVDGADHTCVHFGPQA